MADYLDESAVEDVRRSPVPRRGEQGLLPGQGADGYGHKISTDWEIRVGGKWHRVYVSQSSNIGSAYIRRDGRRLYAGSFEPSDWSKEWYQSYRERQGWPTSHPLRPAREEKSAAAARRGGRR